MRTYLLCAFLLLATAIGSAQTATVSGTINDPSTTNGGTVQLRFSLGGCAGNQPRYNGSALITGETDGANIAKTFTATAGVISGTIYKNDSITCGSSTTSNYWAMRVIRNGVAGPACNVRITAATFNANQPTCLNANPTINLSTLSSLTYLLLDASNAPITGLLTAKGLQGVRNCSSTFYASLSACISDVPAGGVAYIPDNTTWTVATTITISTNISIQCGNRDTSILKTTAAVALFTWTGVVEDFRINNCTLDGNSTGTKVAVVGDFSIGVLDRADGHYEISDNLIKNWTDYSLSFGRSTYFLFIERNYFNLNAGDIFFDRYSEPYIRDNFFNLLASGTSHPHIKGVGASIGTIDGNTFITNGATTGTTPDIILASPSDGADGYIRVRFNKFGSENEVSTRNKIQINGDTTYPFLNAEIVGNLFGCVASQKAIKISTPLGFTRINDNLATTCATFIDDVQSLSAQTSNNNNEAFNNRFYTDGSYVTAMFTNGGRGFSKVYGNGQVGVEEELLGRMGESPELRNRISGNSEDLSGWTKSGITTTTAQTDPFGTTRATLLTRSTTGSDVIYQTVSNSGLGNAVWVSLWAKAGTASRVTVAIQDVTQSTNVAFKTFLLDSTWRRYKFRVGGLAAANTFRNLIYPEYNGTNTGTIVVFGVQVSDYDSDYYPAAGSAVSDTAVGSRHERGVIIGNGGKAIKAIYENSASLNYDFSGAGITEQDLTITVTGAAAGDEVVLGLPTALQAAGIGCTGFVSAADTVTIRCWDITSSGANPAAATVRAQVNHF